MGAPKKEQHSGSEAIREASMEEVSYLAFARVTEHFLEHGLIECSQ